MNAAYYGAIVIRYYIAGSFIPESNRFIPLFYRFAPWYTLACIIVFALFKLYHGMWRFAGIRDLNRILAANAVTCLIQVFGTLLTVGRMPLSYYGLGALIQFVLIATVRYSFQLIRREAAQINHRRKAGASANIMIIGVGQSAKVFLQQLFRDQDNTAHPVCVIDYKNRENGSYFNGLPVVGGLEAIPEAAEKYHVRSVVIADSFMPEEARAKAREICTKLDLGVQDFSGYAQVSSEVNLNQLMRIVDGPVTIELDGKRSQYENGEQAAMALPERYIVQSVASDNGGLLVMISRDLVNLNSIDEAWVKNYEKETGEEVSFF